MVTTNITEYPTLKSLLPAPTSLDSHKIFIVYLL